MKAKGQITMQKFLELTADAQGQHEVLCRVGREAPAQGGGQ